MRPCEFLNGTPVTRGRRGEAVSKIWNGFCEASLYVLICRLATACAEPSLIARRDYESFVRWRHDASSIRSDELLFSGRRSALGVIDIRCFRASTMSDNIGVPRRRDAARLSDWWSDPMGKLHIKDGYPKSSRGNRGLVGSAIVRRTLPEPSQYWTVSRDQLDLRNQKLCGSGSS